MPRRARGRAVRARHRLRVVIDDRRDGNRHGRLGPGLNDEPENVAGDPGWTPQLLGISARSNMDDQGVSLDPSMPTWLTLKGADGKLLTTQDFADIYSFLKTQSGVPPKR